MTWLTTRGALVATLLGGALAGCGVLDVSDPTAIEQSELDNANGANLLRMDALRRYNTAFITSAFKGALLTDELFADTPAFYKQYGYLSYDEVIDRRQSVPYEQQGGFMLSDYQSVRSAATSAMPGLRTYVGPDRLAEMFVVRGYATLTLAETTCPGFPLHRLVNFKPVYGVPLTTDQVFEDALADFDSAVALAADSARIANWARVGRARTLLGLGRFAEAGQAATAVPVLFVQNAQYTSAGGIYVINQFAQPHYSDGYTANVSIANAEGGNGLDFVAANDPRLQTAPSILGADGVTRLYTQKKYPTLDTNVPIATGIEARLIEAEAALSAGDLTTWLDKLNDPRRNAWSTIVPAVAGPLTDLVDPGTDAARRALTFRERAFWLWGTGHRLGDLRRLVARYALGAESVYPTGAYRQGETYDVGTSIPFQASLEARFVPSVTGCTSR